MEKDSLQKKYNKARDQGMSHGCFVIKNDLNKKDSIRLLFNYKKRQKDPKIRIEEIREQLLEHLNENKLSYRTEEAVLNAIQKFLKHAPEDIGFLLKENKRLNEELKQSKKFVYDLGHAQSGKKSKK